MEEEIKYFQNEDGSQDVDFVSNDDNVFTDFVKEKEKLEEVDEPPEFAQFRKDRAWKLDGRKYSAKQIKLFSTLREFDNMPEDTIFNAYRKLKRAWYIVHTYKIQRVFNELEWKDKWVKAGILNPWPKVNGYFYDKTTSERFLEHLREINPEFGKLN